ncbi:MAG TPA: phosphotransferase family protein [Dehalococcoidia bacterium]|nr:phosphotransferase family protein [Dehalococcoidia bacterium]
MSAPSVAEQLLNPTALAAYLDRELPGSGEVEVERLYAGHSNETFYVTRGEQRMVLRRPPLGPLQPTAHDVLREYRILKALEDTPARTPHTVLACEDTSVIGAPFYLMERVDGVVIRDRLPEDFQKDVSARRQIGFELVDALAELQAVDWQKLDLEGFGKPDGYLHRQLRRWSSQIAVTLPMTRPVPELDEVTEWLEENVPEQKDATIVQGDYKLDNVLFAEHKPARLLAILDWEMSTIGDPLADLGWMLSYWHRPGTQADSVTGAISVTMQDGLPEREEMLARYEEKTGRSMREFAFYEALAVWKLAILLNASYARFLQGTTDDQMFAGLKEGVPALARRALRITQGD